MPRCISYPHRLQNTFLRDRQWPPLCSNESCMG
jgi:hypothetical protein